MEANLGPLAYPSHYQEGLTFPSIIPLPDARVLDEVTLLSDPLVTRGAPWDQLSEQQWVFLHSVPGIVTITLATSDGALIPQLGHLYYDGCLGPEDQSVQLTDL